MVTDAPMTLIAKKDLPPKDLKELVPYVKANKDKLSIGSAGPGSVSHLCGILFMSAIDTSLTMVPYKGSGPVMNDLLGGQIDLTCDQATNTISQIKAGKVKAYGVTTKARVAALKDLPALNEGLADFEVTAWHAVYAPQGTPQPIIDKLAKALQASLKDPTVVQRFADLSTEPVAQNLATPEALRTKLAAEIDKWTPIIKKAGGYAE